jgi:pectate lyase
VPSLFLLSNNLLKDCTSPQNVESSILPTIISTESSLTAKEGNYDEVSWMASQNGRTTGEGTAQETVVTDYAQLKATLQNTAVKVIKVSDTITIPAITGG